MISRLLFSLLLIPLVFSEPDLCENPKLDSISYIPDKKMWFFTSAGYYWLINETQFPPGPPKDKLPDLIKKGDAAFYMDYPGLCATIESSSKDVRNDQQISVVENVNGSNKLMGMEVDKIKWGSQTYEWKENKFAGKANIDNPNGQIDAIFTKGEKSDSIHNQIYVIQNQKFAAVDWKGYCKDPKGFEPTAYPSKTIDALSPDGKKFDAMTTKDNQIYMFVDKEFYLFEIDFDGSKDGNIKGKRGQPKDTHKEFFKCSHANNGTDTDTNKGSGTGNGTNSTDLSPKSASEPCGGLLSPIVIMIVVFMIVESTNRSP